MKHSRYTLLMQLLPNSFSCHNGGYVYFSIRKIDQIWALYASLLSGKYNGPLGKGIYWNLEFL